MRRRALRLVAAVTGGVLTLTACAGQPTAGGEAPVASPVPTASDPATGAPTGGSPSPGATMHDQLDLEAPLVEGGTFDGAVSGDVVLWFWAPW